MDLVKVYHWVPMALADVPKTAILTLFGLLDQLFMLFSLFKNRYLFTKVGRPLFWSSGPGPLPSGLLIR
jgi:hypothetical protein